MIANGVWTRSTGPLGPVGGPATSCFKIAILHLLQKIGSREKYPSLCAHSSYDDQWGDCDDALWTGKCTVAMCGDHGIRDDRRMVAYHGSYCVMIACGRCCARGRPQLKFGCDSFLPGVLKKLIHPIFLHLALDTRCLRGGGHRRPPRRILTAESVCFLERVLSVPLASGGDV